jgi:hypothetical protein
MGVPLMNFTLVSSGLACKYQTDKKVIQSDKHFCLQQCRMYYVRKKFYDAGPRVQSYKTFYSRNLRIFIIS